jgi:hypothetical protein
MTNQTHKTSQNTPISYLLLRDNHVVPIYGLDPESIKKSAEHTIFNGGKLKRTSTLNAIVDSLGFKGDFGDYKNSHWPSSFVSQIDYKNFLSTDNDRVLMGMFGFGTAQLMHDQRRHITDRLFESGFNIPQKIFLPNHYSWRGFSHMINRSHFEEFESINEFYGEHTGLTLSAFGEYWSPNYMSDSLFYYEDGGQNPEHIPMLYRSSNDRNYSEARFAEEKEFHKFFMKYFKDFIVKNLEDGWFEVLKLTPSLCLIKFGKEYDFVFRNLRQDLPRIPVYNENLPSWQQENDYTSLYYRKGIWLEKEEHFSEEHYYREGGTRYDYPGSNAIHMSYLNTLGEYPESPQPVFNLEDMEDTEDMDQFKELTLSSGKKILVSELVTCGEFFDLASDKNYWETRSNLNDPWDRANNISDPNRRSLPVGATRSDALVYCSWLEKKFNRPVRLLKPKEYRELCPFPDPHYEFLLYEWMGDFPWERHPPKRLDRSALDWSEPRFEWISKDHEDFKKVSIMGEDNPEGYWRNRWITNFPPTVKWSYDLDLVDVQGLKFIRAWDAYEWLEDGLGGFYYEDRMLGMHSWGAYKNILVSFRVVIDIE